jgi:hypothetical protein
MTEPLQEKTITIRSFEDVIKEVEAAVQKERANQATAIGIKDLRWKFDQISAKMNQAIYNDEFDQVHESCLQTVAVLIEILARS